MPYSSKYDGLQLVEFRALGYDALAKGLDPTPRLVSGSQNCYVDPDATLRKRPALRNSDVGTLTIPTTNAFTFSEEFDNAAWTKSNASVSANATTAPNGTTTADKLIEDATVGVTHHIERNLIGTTDDTLQTLSIYAKAAERTKITLWCGTKAGTFPNVMFNLSDGTVFATNSFAGDTISGAISSAGSGWYKVSITVDIRNGGSTPIYFVSLVDATNATTYTGDGTSGFYIWQAGFQVDNAADKRRCERLWTYETLENPAKVYVLGSWKDTISNKYALYYIRIGTSTEWNLVGTKRSLDNSVYPHEIEVSNGLAYIKSFPDTSTTSEYLGNIITRITLVGALFLGFLAVLPIVLQGITGITALTIGGTALLIVVSVVLDVVKKIDAQTSIREY